MYKGQGQPGPAAVRKPGLSAAKLQCVSSTVALGDVLQQKRIIEVLFTALEIRCTSMCKGTCGDSGRKACTKSLHLRVCENP